MVYVEFEDDVSGEVPSRGLHGGKGPGRHLVRYEAPLGPNGETALGYLKPSGELLGIHPGTGERYPKSDQRFIYDYEEASQLSKESPERFVRCKG